MKIKMSLKITPWQFIAVYETFTLFDAIINHSYWLSVKNDWNLVAKGIKCFLTNFNPKNVNAAWRPRQMGVTVLSWLKCSLFVLSTLVASKHTHSPCAVKSGSLEMQLVNCLYSPWNSLVQGGGVHIATKEVNVKFRGFFFFPNLLK